MGLAGEELPEFFILGKAVGFEFREDFRFVQENFEAAIGEGLQLQPRHALLEFLQNLLRQTDGMRLVLSASAILDPNLHGFTKPG